MSIQVDCVKCQKAFGVPADRAGQQAWCPLCGTACTVPRSAAAAELLEEGQVGRDEVLEARAAVPLKAGVIETAVALSSAPPWRLGKRTITFIALMALLAGGVYLWWRRTKKEMTLDLGGGVKMEFVLIPAGKFTMGSPETEKDRIDWETHHEVTINQPFYMGKYDVTQEQYEAVVGNNPSLFKGPKNPVENVSWDDAQEFCAKLSKKTGNAARLPTEAEWEYACRAGTTTRFYSGDADSALDGVAWYTGNSNQTTHTVGMKQANAWGLYDMHGNVWEWCEDWYGEYAPGAAKDPKGPTTGTLRVLRGGSWGCTSSNCRSANRHWNIPVRLYGSQFEGKGFRVVAEKQRPEEEDRKAAIRAKCRNAPLSAKSALNALKRLQARVEVGVNYSNYSEAVGSTWGEVKIFIESQEGKELSDLNVHFTTAINLYKKAREEWQRKIEGGLGMDSIMQKDWKEADDHIKDADMLLNQ